MPLLETLGSSGARGFGLFGKVSYSQALPNTFANLAAWYLADNWTGSSWTDSSGNGRTATTYTGTITKNTAYSAQNGATKSFTALSSADGSGGIRLPSDLDVNADNYTFFHVTRRINSETTGSDAVLRARIIDGLGDNWLSGFWYGLSGVAYHNNWLTPTDVDNYVNNWVISTDQYNLYRSNAVTRSTLGATAGTISSNTTVTINYGNYGPGGSASEKGKWAVAEVIFFNRKLSSAEYELIEGYLANKYGMTLGI